MEESEDACRKLPLNWMYLCIRRSKVTVTCWYPETVICCI